MDGSMDSHPESLKSLSSEQNRSAPIQCIHECWIHDAAPEVLEWFNLKIEEFSRETQMRLCLACAIYQRHRFSNMLDYFEEEEEGADALIFEIFSYFTNHWILIFWNANDSTFLSSLEHTLDLCILILYLLRTYLPR